MPGASLVAETPAELVSMGRNQIIGVAAPDYRIAEGKHLTL